MKKVVLIFMFLLKFISKVQAQSQYEPSYPIIENVPEENYKISKKEFLGKYGTSDTLRALIRYNWIIIPKKQLYSLIIYYKSHGLPKEFAFKNGKLIDLRAGNGYNRGF